jgi:hypothetical protein
MISGTKNGSMSFTTTRQNFSPRISMNVNITARGSTTATGPFVSTPPLIMITASHGKPLRPRSQYV